MHLTLHFILHIFLIGSLTQKASYKSEQPTRHAVQHGGECFIHMHYYLTNHLLRVCLGKFIDHDHGPINPA